MLKKLLPIITFFLLGLVSFTWFRDSQYLLGVDTIFPISIAGINEYFSIWSNRVLYSEADIFKLPVIFPLFLSLRLWVLAGLPYSAVVAERFLIYILFSFSGFSLYFLIRKVFSNVDLKLAVLGGFLYMFSFYFMYLITPIPFFLIFTYAFFPFALGLYIKNLDSKFSFSRAVFFALISFLLLVPSYATPPYFILHIFLFSFCSIFLMLRNSSERAGIFKSSIVFGVTFCCLNLFWILPVILSPRNNIDSFMITSEAPYSNYKNNSVKIMDAVRQQGYFGLGGEYKHVGYYGWFGIYKHPIAVVLTLIVPLLFILGFYFLDFKKINSRDKNYFLLFGSLFILFCILLSFPSAPYNNIFKSFLEKIGFFYMFRTAYQRFSSYVLLTLLLCFVFILDYISKNIAPPKRRYVDYFLIFIVLVNIFQVHPLVFGTLFDKNKIFPSIRATIPQYFLDFASYMDSKPESRSMVLPLNELGLYSYWWSNGNNGYAGVYPLTNLSTSRNLYLGYFFKDLIRLTSLAPSGISMFMRAYHIDSVVFYNDLAWHLIQDNTWNSTDSYRELKPKLDLDPCLSKSKSFSEIDIYVLKDVCQDFTDVSLLDLKGGIHSKYYTKIPDSSSLLKIMSEGRYYFSDKETATNNRILSVTPVADLFVGDSYWNNNWTWPDATIDPKSVLYPLVRLKENIVLSFTPKHDYSYSDGLTWLLSKRVEEQEKFKAPSPEITGMLSQLVSSFDGPMLNKTDILNKSVLYLRKASNYSSNNETKKLLNSTIETLKSIWKVKRSECFDFCYAVYSPETAEYKILFKESNLPFLKNYKIYVNSKELGQVKDGSSINLAGGSSLISFSRIASTNLLEGIPPIEYSGVNYQFPSSVVGTPIMKEITVTGLVPNSTYDFSFDYELASSHFQFLVYNFKSDFSRDPGAEKMLKYYETGLTPNSMLKIETKNDLYVDARNGSKSSYMTSFKTGSEISKEGKIVFNLFADKRVLKYGYKVSNFKLIKKEDLDFSLLKVETDPAPKVNLTATRISPFLYKVQLPSSLPDKFVLSLDEKFAQGWQLFVKSPEKFSLETSIVNFGNSFFGFNKVPSLSLLQTENFELNFVKNGWVVNKDVIPVGTGELYIYYFPQKYLAISVLCVMFFSGLLFIGLIVYFVRKHVKHI